MKPSSLTDTSKPWGKIRFIHKDGTEHTFWSEVNDLTGDRLSAFDGEPPSINDSLKWVKSVFRDIKAKAEVLEMGGDLAIDS